MRISIVAFLPAIMASLPTRTARVSRVALPRSMTRSVPLRYGRSNGCVAGAQAAPQDPVSKFVSGLFGGNRGQERVHPVDDMLRSMDKARRDLAKHCFGPACSLDSYDYPTLEETREPRRVHPVDNMVRKMEKARQDLAKHCFGPACNIDSYDFPVGETGHHPVDDEVRAQDKLRNELAKHSYGTKAKKI
mmetsp:Transcript_20524/g.41358  ORF Transcript_20524/g.41358 Transcript_20524/m.41358 type:complete len:190 (+) Transcript_20524:84-653(+)